MNEIALANFYRVLNDADRFPTEKELAEAAIAAKDELNSLRAHPQPIGSVEAEATDEALQALVDFTDAVRGASFHYPYQSEQYVRWLDLVPQWKKAHEVIDRLSNRKHLPKREGYVSVPREPTPEMLEAAYTESNSGKVECRHIWDLMLSAIEEKR